MLALYRAGRQADALDAFRARPDASWWRSWGSSRGLSCSGSKPPCWRRIPRSSSSAPPRRLRRAPAVALPARAAGLVGREAELDAVAALLRDPAMRLVTVLGPGGVGKTRLALELAHRLAGEFRDGARFVPLAAIDTRERLEQELEAGRCRRRAAARAGQLRAAGRTPRRWWRTCSPGRPGVTVLVTSQAALRLSGEHEVPLAPLAVDAAVELFVAPRSRARRRRRGDRGDLRAARRPAAGDRARRGPHPAALTRRDPRTARAPARPADRRAARRARAATHAARRDRVEPRPARGAPSERCSRSSPCSPAAGRWRAPRRWRATCSTSSRRWSTARSSCARESGSGCSRPSTSSPASG